jgi:hypothetical protein
MLTARKTLGAAMSALMLIVAAYAVYRSSVYQECTTNKSFMTYVDCLGPFAHENHGPIVAVFTIILAFSTIALWISTRDAALAAKAAAEHIPRAERAFIHGGVHPDGRTLVGDGKKIRVRFSMANYGKTPGFIKSVKVGSGQFEGLSNDPNYSSDVPVCGGTVLGYASKDSGYESGSGANENDSDVTLWVINPPRGPVVIKLHTTAHAFSTWDAEVNGKPCRRKVLD